MLDLFKNDDGKKRFNKSLSGGISIPFGYWTFDTSMSYSKERHIIDKVNKRKVEEEHFATGKTESKSYGIDRVLYKGDKYKLNAGTRLKIKDKESYRGEEKNNGGEEGRTSNGSIYINNTIYTKNGALTIKPTYQRGLNWFGAKNDKDSHKEESKKDRDEKFEYDLINLYLCFNTKVNIPLLTRDKELKRKRLPLQYTVAVNSQYSFDNLYGSNQINIGGQGTVRGFMESQISGDNGVYIKNDVGVRMLELVPEKLWKTKVMEQKRSYLFEESPKTILSKTKLGIFYDIGYVKKYKQIDKDCFNDRYMMGTGVSLSYSGKYVNSTLTYSKSLHDPLKEKEKQAIYWEIGISW
ncbi:hypothetical protein AGMMS49950_02000 [Endomicrobiia bacterium]|nr:hypothetical protein AGMMS49950_02000 [Endomicrobiia bacterium]